VDAPPTDAILDLQHDHEGLDARVEEVAVLIRGLADPAAAPTRAAVAAEVGELSEELLHHFAREEEGLFPFVTTALPDLEAPVADLLVAHDAVCGALARIVHALHAPPSADEPAGDARVEILLDRFEQSYRDHAARERALLGAVAGRVTPAQRAELAARVREV